MQHPATFLPQGMYWTSRLALSPLLHLTPKQPPRSPDRAAALAARRTCCCEASPTLQKP